MSTAKVTHSNWSAQWTPEWAGDFLSREHLLPGGAKLNPAAFNPSAAAPVTVTTTSEASAEAETIAVEALSGPIPTGTPLYFPPGGFAVTTADALAGATSIAVDALLATIPSGSVATYTPPASGEGITHIPSGTPVSRSYEDRDSGIGFGPADPEDDEFYLLAFDVTDVTDDNDCDLYRHGGIVKENFLPGADEMDPDVLARIRELYEVTIGAV